MLKVSADEFQRNIGRYQELAMTEPVTVTRDGRDCAVLVSTDEYNRLKRRDRIVMSLDDFTDTDIALLEQSRPAAAAKAHDDELTS